MAEPQPETVALMVLAKGFRVSQETEEFQLVWPPSAKALAYETERRLLSHEAWPGVLQALYSMTAAEVQTLPCVLLTPSSATSISVASAKDRYNRPMIVAVCATAPIVWKSNDVEDTVSQAVARIVALGRFAAERLARRFDGNPKDVNTDLRSEKFEFNLSECAGPNTVDLRYWRSVIRSAREWRNISGLDSPPLVALGANVLLGTEHEAMRFAGTGGSTIDGFYEPGTGRIVPISRNLTRWQQHWQPKDEATPVPVPAPPPPPAPSVQVDDEQPSAPAPSPVNERLESIDNSLKNIDRSVEVVARKGVTFIDVGIAFMQAGMEFWFGKAGKRDKR